jgi:hypothetical protein
MYFIKNLVTQGVVCQGKDRDEMVELMTYVDACNGLSSFGLYKMVPATSSFPETEERIY